MFCDYGGPYYNLPNLPNLPEVKQKAKGGVKAPPDVVFYAAQVLIRNPIELRAFIDYCGERLHKENKI